jgi:hypothetical protein
VAVWQRMGCSEGVAMDGLQWIGGSVWVAVWPWMGCSVQWMGGSGSECGSGSDSECGSGRVAGWQCG